MKLTNGEKNEMKEGVLKLVEGAEVGIFATDKGVGVVGMTDQVLTTLTMIVKQLVELGVDKELIEHSFKLGLIADKPNELLKELNSQLDKLLEKLDKKEGEK